MHASVPTATMTVLNMYVQKENFSDVNMSNKVLSDLRLANSNIV